jgi:hypothetical protein
MPIGTLEQHVTGRKELARVEAAECLIAPRGGGFAFGDMSALGREVRPVDVLQEIENELEGVRVEQAADESASDILRHLATISPSTSQSRISVSSSSSMTYED